MKKVTYTVLFLLGLVFQPYIGVISASSKADDGETMLSSMSMASSELEMDANFAANLCHQSAQDNLGCCDSDCLTSGHCINNCASVSPNTIDVQRTGLGFFRIKDLQIEVQPIAYVYWQPSFIYHPPKLIHNV